MKLKSVYVCSSCSAQSPKWSGQCLQCKGWNTLVEDVINLSAPGQSPSLRIKLKGEPCLGAFVPEARRLTGIGELDRVLGGGFMNDAVVLLAGDPGIGKSTLTLQLCQAMAQQKQKVLYFSAEESVSQVRERAGRLSIKSDFDLFAAHDLSSIAGTIESQTPGFVVVDSVQAIASGDIPGQAGGVAQVRFVAETLMRLAKSRGFPLLLISHVTKEGVLAGPQTLSHLVDTVLYLESDASQRFRLLRSAKNRFGAVDEVGVFRMESSGLAEVKNPSAAFLEGRPQAAIGSVVTPIMEGTRVFLVEVQALTASSSFGYPKRTASGFDLNRLSILIAVLDRYAGLRLDSSDVFVNVAGGLKLREPAADLAVALAIASSKLKKPFPSPASLTGEVGLAGEIRAVSQAEKRGKEAAKLGFPFPEKTFKTVAQAIECFLGPLDAKKTKSVAGRRGGDIVQE